MTDNVSTTFEKRHDKDPDLNPDSNHGSLLVEVRRLGRILIIQMPMFMVLSSWQSHCESSPGSFDECRTAPSGRRLETKQDDLGCESDCSTGCQNLHSPSPFIIITQPEN